MKISPYMNVYGGEIHLEVDDFPICHADYPRNWYGDPPKESNATSHRNSEALLFQLNPLGLTIPIASHSHDSKCSKNMEQ